MSGIELSKLDEFFAVVGRSMLTIFASPAAARPSPANAIGGEDDLNDHDRSLAGALMRVNHVGEVCAQALYEGQALTTMDQALAGKFREAAAEEADHLAWTRERLDELGARPSVLNPFWFAGAFVIGTVAGRLGDRLSLSFMAETERQVEQHLDGHLERLPEGDARSRAIVQVMKEDESGHAQTALRLGGVELPAPVRSLMRQAARVMTTTAHHL